MTGLMAVKDAIKAELRKDGCSQADLARYRGVTQKHLSRVLTGKQAASPAFIEQMAAAVGLRLVVTWGDQL